ncbi:hypothetical protein ElyMa_005849200 [Elysia marginata]|uniref:Uncharacterized protein n=1 Tax=Elysia marginata TaxID=1093978 RepID=A0AAV4FYM2_9GAST|nr:hypothetical protein ElyMa_005849200 [Elysia marginata]
MQVPVFANYVYTQPVPQPIPRAVRLHPYLPGYFRDHIPTWMSLQTYRQLGLQNRRWLNVFRNWRTLSPDDYRRRGVLPDVRAEVSPDVYWYSHGARNKLRADVLECLRRTFQEPRDVHPAPRAYQKGG